MSAIYFLIVVFLLCLALFDLYVGVSNDAVNFLQSAVGARVAAFRTILFVASAGVILGAVMSSGMMDVARHGIMMPDRYAMSEVMVVFLAVMVTDVIVLDVFNSLGMPTSTTVSLVFELLGAAAILAAVKMMGDGSLQINDLLNTDKALSVILAIFVSVAVAFVFGVAVQWIARLVFTFRQTGGGLVAVALFGGIAFTALAYFIFLKGMGGSPYISESVRTWIGMHIPMLLLTIGGVSTVLMGVLHLLRINVFRIVVLMGTFALAMAFAGNDLVNFIGVPLAGYSSFMDYTANGAEVGVDGFLMTSLTQSARTPWIFLFGAGIIMVYALATSKKAQNVIKTSVDLARQDEGEEGFGSTPLARTLVRVSLSMANGMSKIVPLRTQQWVGSRFCKDEAILANGAAFDLVRASVNLVLAGLLIAVGTSLKLPLSTTYVTFMVAMGSSLAARAWGRDSAVYRSTGVLSVISGWFITAGAAFTICYFVTTLIYFGGTTAILIMIALVIFMLIRSQVMYRQRKAKEKEDEVMRHLMRSNDNTEILTLLRQHTRETLTDVLEFIQSTFELTVRSFLKENLRGLRRANGAVKFEKQQIKQMKRSGTLAACRLDNRTILEKGFYYHQGNDFASEMVYSIGRLCEPCLEHVDNNFSPLNEEQKTEFRDVAEDIIYLIQSSRLRISSNSYGEIDEEMKKASILLDQLANLKQRELQRIQDQSGSIKTSMVYLTMIHESKSLVNYTINLLKVSKKFQE